MNLVICLTCKMHPVWKTEASIVGLSVLGVLFLIVSVSTNYWRSFRSKDVYSHQGLWKTCEHVFATGKRECVKLERSKYDELWGSVEFDAVIALMLASILMQIWTMIFGAIVYRRKKHLMIVVAVFQALTVVAMVVGLIIYSHFFKREKFTVDWSYIIGWGGAVCIFVGFALLIVLLKHSQWMPLETAFVYENTREGH